MLRHYGVVREVARIIDSAAKDTCLDYRSGLFDHEPSFTDRMLGRIATALDGYKSRGVQWKARTLTSSSSNSEEARYGADFMGALDVGVTDYTVQKGFLAQAKRLEPGEALSQRDFQRLVQQCRRMLCLTPAAFVFLYAKTGVEVVPAIAVVGSSCRDPRKHYSRSFSRFFEEHLESFLGDPRISVAGSETLEDLRKAYEYRAGLLLTGREVTTP